MNVEIITSVKVALAETLKFDNANSINTISDEATLREDLGLDSMLSLTFLMALEDHIEGFIVDAETLEAEDLINVKSVSKYVEKQLKRTA